MRSYVFLLHVGAVSCPPRARLPGFLLVRGWGLGTRLRLVKSTCNEYNSVSVVRRIQPQENDDEQELVMKGECVCVNTKLIYKHLEL